MLRGHSTCSHSPISWQAFGSVRFQWSFSAVSKVSLNLEPNAVEQLSYILLSACAYIGISVLWVPINMCKCLTLTISQVPHVCIRCITLCCMKSYQSHATTVNHMNKVVQQTKSQRCCCQCRSRQMAPQGSISRSGAMRKTTKSQKWHRCLGVTSWHWGLQSGHWKSRNQSLWLWSMQHQAACMFQLPTGKVGGHLKSQTGISNFQMGFSNCPILWMFRLDCADSTGLLNNETFSTREEHFEKIVMANWGSGPRHLCSCCPLLWPRVPSCSPFPTEVNSTLSWLYGQYLLPAPLLPLLSHLNLRAAAWMHVWLDMAGQGSTKASKTLSQWVDGSVAVWASAWMLVDKLLREYTCRLSALDISRSRS